MDTIDDQNKNRKFFHSENLSPYQSLLAILLISMLVFASVLFYPSNISEQFNFPSLALWRYHSDSSLLTNSSGDKDGQGTLESSSFMTDEQVNLAQLLLELASRKNSSSSTSYSQVMRPGT